MVFAVSNPGESPVLHMGARMASDGRPDHLVVIGGSAGAWPVLQTIIRNLPADFPAAITAVIHRSPHVSTDMAGVLNSITPLQVVEPKGPLPLRAGHLYLAPPDHHLKVDAGSVVPTRGPREHHTRPAIDVLFRSAAREFGRGVTAVLLSGTGSDGTAGTMAVRSHGGTIVVQAHEDAEHPGMPRRAASITAPDHAVRPHEIAALLPGLVGGTGARAMSQRADPIRSVIDSTIAAQEHGERTQQVSTYSCPDCGGVLWQVDDHAVVQFVCHTGHRWAPHTLLVEKTEGLEAALFEAVRLLKEKAMLLRQVAAKASANGDAGARLLEQAGLDDGHAALIQAKLLEGTPSSLSNARLEDDVARETGIGVRKKD
jgi:two-component system chemotaxis response regulator CheB